MKTLNQEEPVTRSRFIECPQCKSRGLKLKRIVQVGRCRNCRESYKIVIVFVKTGTKSKQEPGHTHSFETKETTPESTLPSWEFPSDSSLFGSTAEAGTSPSYESLDLGWEENKQTDSSETGTER